ncbi:hypothetical protein [Robiginitomaculum antarcticum]|uniref:hypothetical protein n=1 Tax=Robiginitomaculum antarcticum TaxID=437507 RepID=UPI00037294B2|nr:hypothetical protein [Robiginitomaculum antarcticum]
MGNRKLNYRFAFVCTAAALTLGGCGEGPDQIDQTSADRPAEPLYAPAQISEVSLTGQTVRIQGFAPSEVQVSVIERATGDLVAQNLTSPEQLRQMNWDISWEIPDQNALNSILEYQIQTSLGDAVTAISPELLTLIRRSPDMRTGAAAVLVLRPGAATLVMQSPFEPPTTQDGLRLSSIDYDDDGGVIFSGMSAQNGRIRIYVDGRAIGDTGLDEGGNWAIILGGIVPVGTYPIEVHLIGAPGEIMDRIAVPFMRRAPVEAGQTLDSNFWSSPAMWQYRYELPGGGVQHTVIYSQSAKILPPLSSVKSPAQP